MSKGSNLTDTIYRAEHLEQQAKMVLNGTTHLHSALVSLARQRQEAEVSAEPDGKNWKSAYHQEFHRRQETKRELDDYRTHLTQVGRERDQTKEALELSRQSLEDARDHRDSLRLELRVTREKLENLEKQAGQGSQAPVDQPAIQWALRMLEICFGSSQSIHKDTGGQRDYMNRLRAMVEVAHGGSDVRRSQ